MKLENQVVSLELANKLKELGVKQESLFYWNLYNEKIEYGRPIGIRHISAFTVAELGEMLPKFILYDGYSNILKIERHSCWVFSYGKSILYSAGTFENEADARAKILIYLIENDLMLL